MRNVRMTICLVVVCVMAVANFASAATWTTPEPVTELNGGYLQIDPFLTADGKSLYFARANGPTSGNMLSIYEATRQNPSGPFTSINKVLSDNYHAESPWVSADGLRMYYDNESYLGWRLKVSTRTSINDSWSVGTGISEINALGLILHPWLTGDELTIFFDHVTSTSWDIWTASRPDRNSAFGNIRSLTELNTSAVDGTCSVTADGLAIYFASERNGSSEIFKASRNSLSDPFGNIEHLSFLDSPGYSTGFPGINADGTALYFNRGNDIYVTYIPEPATVLLLCLGAVMLRKKK